MAQPGTVKRMTAQSQAQINNPGQRLNTAATQANLNIIGRKTDKDVLSQIANKQLDERFFQVLSDMTLNTQMYVRNKENVLVHVDTMKPVDMNMAKDDRCLAAGVAIGKDCSKMIATCLSGGDPKKCLEYMSSYDYFHEMTNHIEKLNPMDAVTHAKNLGFKVVFDTTTGLRRIESVESWSSGLHTKLKCETTNEIVCRILENVKLMEYLYALVGKINGSPAILNVNVGNVSHHNLEKDDCCETKGYDIRPVKNIPGSFQRLHRLKYMVNTNQRLLCSLMGIPYTSLVQPSVTGGLTFGGPNINNVPQLTSNLMNQLENIKFSAGDVRKVYDNLKASLKQSGLLKGEQNFVKEMEALLPKLADSERKTRIGMTAMASLLNTVDRLGPNAVDSTNPISFQSLEKMRKMYKSYYFKSQRRSEGALRAMLGLVERRPSVVVKMD